MHKFCTVITTALLLLSLGAPVFAQTAGGAALTGTVTDSSGAVVANAKISATNVATNQVYETQATDAGVYRFASIPVGTYKVTVEAQGFKSTQIDNLVLTVGQTVTQNVTLDAGAPSEAVTITASGE